MVIETKIQRLHDLCGIAGGDLSKLEEQISHIVEIKKKTSEKLNKDVMRLQASDVLKPIENLDKINAELVRAISNISRISQEIQLLLKKQHEEKPKSAAKNVLD